MKRHSLQLLLLIPSLALSSPWSFKAPITVAGSDSSTHFHHLDGAGRKHIAANEHSVSMIWEDDRDGSPQVFLAIKSFASGNIENEFRLSSGEEAYEPAIVSIDGRRWLAAWEQDEFIWGCIVNNGSPGPATRLSEKPARQVTLASDGKGHALAVWAVIRERGQYISAADLKITDDKISTGSPVPVTGEFESSYQAYPSATLLDRGQSVIAWEDRRAGHTRLFTSHRRAAGQAFSPELQFNEHNEPPPVDEGTAVMLGSGVMRVSLAKDLSGAVQAVWMDKRNPASGYAVWGAPYRQNSQSFDVNHQIQDELGAAVPQWHASVEGGSNGFVAVWDDTREAWSDDLETGDVILSWQTDTGWSDDLILPHASGEGYQGSPALSLDPAGNLHLLWIERRDLNSPSRLHYMLGVRRAP